MGLESWGPDMGWVWRWMMTGGWPRGEGSCLNEVEESVEGRDNSLLRGLLPTSTSWGGEPSSVVRLLIPKR